MKRKVILPLLLLASLLLGSCGPLASSSVKDFEFEALSLRYDAALAEDVRGEIVPSGKRETFGYSDALPEHLAVTFSSYYPQRALDPKTLNDVVGAQIFVYPTANWWPASDWFSPPEVFPNLEGLLAARPESPELPIPTLPIWPHTQVFRSQVKYLDFQNGNGVRFITQYGVEATPVTNREIFYSFQGLTQDGSYYVAAYFPIAAAGLDDEPIVEDWEAFNARYQNDLVETVGRLNALFSDQFEPNLDLLDALIQSMALDTSKSPVDMYGKAIPHFPPTAVVDSSATHQATAETHTGLRFDCQKIQELSVDECQALVALYESTDGVHWKENSGRLTNETPCTWIGVICQQGHVIELHLSYNELRGSLPPQIGNLANLNQLHLTHNQLSGSIPATLGNLTILNELDLSFNQLTGSIPTELAHLSRLYRLYLSYNRLTGTVPPALAKAPIADLRLWGNLLDGTVPASQGKITAVDYQGVKFELDSALAKSIWPEIVAALPPVKGEFSWATRPEHIRFTLASHGEPDPFQGGGMNISGDPQIFIYPTEPFSAMDDIVKGEIEGLQTLLEARPASPENEIPVLPLINAAQVFHVQLEYLDFQNGGGVRFITHYSQEDVSRLTKKNIFYTFQGLTQDGDYYVAAYFPISVAGWRDKPVDEDWDAALACLAEDVKHLDGLASHEFEPDLEILDSVIQSLIVNTP